MPGPDPSCGGVGPDLSNRLRRVRMLRCGVPPTRQVCEVTREIWVQERTRLAAAGPVHTLRARVPYTISVLLLSGNLVLQRQRLARIAVPLHPNTGLV